MKPRNKLKYHQVLSEAWNKAINYETINNIYKNKELSTKPETINGLSEKEKTNTAR